MKRTDNSKYHSHGEVWLLLPWYVNGCLSGEQKKFVASHLDVCLVCRKELANQYALSETIKQAEDTKTLAMNASFERLKRRIAQADQKPEPQNVNALERLVSWLKAWLGPVRSRTAVLASVAVVALLVFPVLMIDFGNSLEIKSAEFRTLSNSSTERPRVGDIRIVFKKGLNGSEKANILASIDGWIVDQPSTNEVFSIRIEGQNTDVDKVTTAIEALRQRKEVIFVEPVFPSMAENNLQSEGKK